MSVSGIILAAVVVGKSVVDALVNLIISGRSVLEDIESAV